MIIPTAPSDDDDDPDEGYPDPSTDISIWKTIVVAGATVVVVRVANYGLDIAQHMFESWVERKSKAGKRRPRK